jgi:hypothetical protein
VQFRKDGWHDEAIKRVVLCVLHERVQGMSRTSVRQESRRMLGITLDDGAVDAQIEKLIMGGSISESASNLFLSQAERIRLDGDRTEAESIVERCRVRLEKSLRSHGTIGSISWDSFVRELLIPMTNELGSRTFDLLRGSTPVHDTTAARAFVDSFPEPDREAVRNTVAEYLDPADADVQRHLLGYLTNYTLLSAGGLSAVQIDSLLGESGPISLDVLIDTNVAFSMLKLHRNPMNDATQALLQLREHLGDGVSLRFHMLTATVDEAKRSLVGAMHAAPRAAAPPVFEKAAEESGFLSGLLEGYLHARVANRLLSAESYFQPYVDGFETIMQEHQISILDHEDAADLARVQQRTDNWMTYEKGAGRGKSRDQIEHDVLAIETVRQKRGEGNHTASNARWWIVTLDLRLQSRERKDLGGSRRLPSTINPAELVQLVRLWVPRSAATEQALVGAIRMPFSFYSYEPELEKSALRILSAIAGVEGISDISPSAALRVFQDATLRAQLSAATPGSDKEVEAVVAATVRIDLEFQARAEAAEAELRRVQAAARSTAPTRPANGGRAKPKNDLIKERDRLAAKVDRLTDELRKSKEKAANAVLRADDAQERIANLHRLAAERAARRTRILRVLLISVAILGVLAAVAVFFLLPDPTGRIGSGVSLGVSAVALIIQLLLFLPRRRPTLEERIAARLERALLRNAGLSPYGSPSGVNQTS